MNGRSLVLIEDDAGDTLLVTEMLLEVAPHMVITCFTTLQSALNEWPPDGDCVLLDLGLPDAMGRRSRGSARTSRMCRSLF